MWERQNDAVNALQSLARLQTATTATTLPASRVRGDGGHVLDAADAHAGAGQGAERALGTRARSLGAHTTGAADADVDGSDADLLAARGAVLRGKHGSVRRRLVTVRLDLHTAGNTDDGLLAGEIRHMDKGIVERGVDAVAVSVRSTSVRPHGRPKNTY